MTSPDATSRNVISAPHPRPQTAMVLAAGLGQRMRPITETLPKPLIRIGGKTMLDHALDRLADAGITHAVVNVHYLADQIETHLDQRTQDGRMPRITISDERGRLLETGGGVKTALPHLGSSPFVHVNSDSLWVEEARSNLSDLLDAWDPARMDVLLLLASRAHSIGFDGAGDFELEDDGRLSRRGAASQATYVYAGVAILKPGLFDDAPDGPFSLNRQFDRAITAGTLHGHVLQGTWLHVGTPEAIAPANARLARRAV